MNIKHSRHTLIGIGLLLAFGAPVVQRRTPIQDSTRSSHPLVFDGVTVVDVERGRLLRDQRVVIVGTRISAMGGASAVPVPAGAQVVDARGKYLIPGLWDLHVHSGLGTELFYPLYITSGITGIRDAGSDVPLDTQRRWRSEILAGMRVGPPRMIFSGLFLNNDHGNVGTKGEAPSNCVEAAKAQGIHRACVVDTADTRQTVEARVAEGVDMIKLRMVSRAEYFAGAAAARRLHVPFGGHIEFVSALEAADSGARIVDHATHFGINIPEDRDTSRNVNCFGPQASEAQCRAVAEHFRQHGTWLVATLMFLNPDQRTDRYKKLCDKHWGASDKPTSGNWLQEAMPTDKIDSTLPAAKGDLALMRRVGVPLLAGTDQFAGPGGFALHGELATFVAEGLTPLEALQTATLNPAKMWHATDSLGTVAPGKLADLVLLDANPLADITNTTTIRAVVANGRYYDRTTLDQLDAHVRESSH